MISVQSNAKESPRENKAEKEACLGFIDFNAMKTNEYDDDGNVLHVLLQLLTKVQWQWSH